MASSVIISFNARGEVLEKSTLGMYHSLFQLLTAIPNLQNEFMALDIEELKTIFAFAIENLGLHVISAE